MLQRPVDLEPDSEGELESGEIDDSILDLNTDDQHPTPARTTGYTSPTRASAPASMSPLQPATASGGITFLQPTMPPPRSMALHTAPVATQRQSNLHLARTQCLL